MQAPTVEISLPETPPSETPPSETPPSETASLLKAIESGTVPGLLGLIKKNEKNKRLLEIEIRKGETLIDIVCKEGNAKQLDCVLKAFRKNKMPAFSDAKAQELLLACASRTQEVGVKFVIDHCAWSPAKREDFFKHQVSEGHELLVAALVKNKFVEIDKPLDEENNTALHLAVMNDKLETVRRLITLGADSQLRNKDGLDIEQLAKKRGNERLARSISDCKKSQVGRKSLQQLESEIAELRQENMELQQRLARAEAALLQQHGGFFGGSASKPVLTLTMAQQKNQDAFVAAILSGDLGKAMMMHTQQSGLIDRANLEGMLPLQAAAYSGVPEVFNYIQTNIQDDPNALDSIDPDRALQASIKSIPEARPKNATYAWLADWHKANAGKPWCKKYDNTVGQWSDNSPDWAARQDIWSRVEGGTFDPQAIWDKRTQLSSATERFCIPSPEEHDAFVAQLISDLTYFKYYMTKLAEAKSQKNTMGFQ